MSTHYGSFIWCPRFLLPFVCLTISLGCSQRVTPAIKQESAAQTKEPPIANEAAERLAAQHKRDAQEKLLLLEKEQVSADIERITGCIEQDQNWRKEWEEKLAKVEADWKAQRIGTFAFQREQRVLDDNIERATARVDRDLTRCKDLRKRIEEIDLQLKKLYEQTLAE